MRDFFLNRLNVVVLYGGVSPEHEVSKMSAATIVSNIEEEKYNVIPLYITKEGEWLLYDGSVDNLNNIQWKKFGTKAVLSPDKSDRGLIRIVNDKVKVVPVDVVFPVLHGSFGEDGTIQGLLELAGIPYVGCGVTASAVSMDKAFTKLVASSMGVKQAEYVVFNRSDVSSKDSKKEAFKKLRKIGYPCFVKPANAGSSVGITKVMEKKELEKAIDIALQHDDKVIIEKAVAGRELECAVLGNYNTNVEATSVGEILSGGEFYDYDSKYVSSDSKTIVNAELPAEKIDEIRNLAIIIFKAVNGKGLARVDFFLEDGTDKVIFNEINTMPGFTKISMYPMLWNEAGLPLPALIDKLIMLALESRRA